MKKSLYAIALVVALPVVAEKPNLQPCTIGKLPPPVVCGQMTAFENRTTNAGRKITLNIVVARAMGANPLPDPVFALTGGPGESAVLEAEGIVDAYADLRNDRDIVLVDQRGTGKYGLECGLHTRDPQALFGPMFPIESVRLCRDSLSKDHDLTQYTTANFIEDLEDVRKALGYSKINLIGGSYGSRAALVYLRMHPDVIRSAAISGVMPTSVNFTAGFPRGAERSIQMLFQACAANASCHASFPDPQKDLDTTLQHLAEHSASVSFKEPGTQKPIMITLTRQAFVERVRYLLYPADGRKKLPQLLHETATGKFSDFVVETYPSMQGLYDALNFSLLLSVMCSEEIAFLEATSTAHDAAGTFFGNGRMLNQIEACNAWPYAKLDRRAVTDPVRFSGPIILIGGEVDPATPPQYMEIAARTLPQSRLVVLRGASHQDSNCIVPLMNDFIRKPSTNASLAACASLPMPAAFTTR